MRKYGNIIVLSKDDFYEGTVVETMGNGEVASREYFTNKFKVRQVRDTGIKVDIFEVAKKKTPKQQMNEIANQIGTKKFAIDEGVISFIKNLKEEL